jgi:hypothetical protein
MVADTRHPGGRPAIGPPIKYALPPALRAALLDARRTDADGTTESEASAVRRLLAAALDPAVPAALRQHAADLDARAEGRPELAARAAELRALADQLT